MPLLINIHIVVYNNIIYIYIYTHAHNLFDENDNTIFITQYYTKGLNME